MNHKSFVFFDCECANTFEGIGKICSFGYVLCDDELNIIESQDVVMNPECEFDWYLFSGKGGCQLAYSKDYFRSKAPWNSYYKDIKKLLTTGNRYIAGFAVSNDVGFVNNACERYEEEYIQFRAFDVEKFLEKEYGKKQKLAEWAEELGVNLEKFQSHKSVDDAIMTMLCLKAFCIKSGKSAEEILSENKGLFVSNEQILEQAAQRAWKKEILEKIKRLYNKKSPMPRHKTLVGKKFELDAKVLKDPDTAFDLVRQIYDNGGITGEHLNSDATLICLKKPDEKFAQKIKSKGMEIITVEELKAILK